MPETARIRRPAPEAGAAKPARAVPDGWDPCPSCGKRACPDRTHR